MPFVIKINNPANVRPFCSITFIFALKSGKSKKPGPLSFTRMGPFHGQGRRGMPEGFA